MLKRFNTFLYVIYDKFLCLLCLYRIQKENPFYNVIKMQTLQNISKKDKILDLEGDHILRLYAQCRRI
jgi:hypothetical protein